jgi:release factor glutamine methyltransferase
MKSRAQSVPEMGSGTGLSGAESVPAFGRRDPTGQRSTPEPPVADRPNLQPAAPPLVEILRRSTEHLTAVNMPTPRLDSELILAHVLGLSRIDLYLQFDRPLLESELQPVRDLLRRRAAGCPVAYLVGQREFHSLTFTVAAGVLIPRPESELLVDLGAALVDGRPARVLDLGCGSGCVGLAVARAAPAAQVDLVDLGEKAVEISRRNASAVGVEDRVAVLQGSWVGPVVGRGAYDLVLSNPPYVTTAEWEELDRGVKDFEPRLALDGGPDGLSSYREILAVLPQVVAPGAAVLLEGDPRRLSQVAELARAAWPTAQTAIRRDLSGKDRVLEVLVP